jgi:hypothetical protein
MEPNVICQCGCGSPTYIPPFTSKKRGWTKGVPLLFVRGHHWRTREIAPSNYKSVTVGKKHAKTIHTVRAERALGKSLPKGAIVHHADGSKNPNTQLVICQDQSYHAMLHARQRVATAGGNPNTDRICGSCGLVKKLEEFHVRWCSYQGRAHKCKECTNKDHRDKWRTR